MRYAVIRIKGRQYKVSEGDTIFVDKLKEEELASEVLFYVDEKKVEVGKPTLNKVDVKLKIIENVKGEKIDVLKYKAKSRYRKHIGFRPQLTKVLVEKVSQSSSK